MSTLTDLTGLVAAFCTTSSFLPQAIKTWRSRSAADFSWPYLGLFGFGVTLWDLYGVLRGDQAIVLANTLTLGLVLVIIWVKAAYPRRIDSLKQTPLSR